MVILALANPENGILAINPAWNNVIHLAVSQMETLNFIQLSNQNSILSFYLEKALWVN